jgi:C_GCAxxG_C_C family probable redox protein
MEKQSIIETARKLYLEEGYSCSESVILSIRKAGLDIPDAILRSVTGLRAGIGGSGCVCGVLMAAVLLVGYYYGRTSNKEDEKKANKLSAELHDIFKQQLKSTCCRVLARKYDFKSRERKEFCAGIIEFLIPEILSRLSQETDYHI